MASSQTSPSPDSELLARFAGSRDEDAFAMLMKKHWGFAYSIARRSLPNDALAEDATQQAFIALSRNAQKLSKSTSLGPWLFRTVNHECSNIRRREQRHQKRNRDYAEASSRNPEPSNYLSRKLHQGLNQLSTKERELILLRFYEGLTADQIGAKLKISPAAAQRRTHRALERLSTFANTADQDQQSLHLSLPALLSPNLLPTKEALTTILSSPASASTSLLLPTAGWLIATTLCVATAKQVVPKLPPAQPAPTQTVSSTRTLRTPTPPALPDDPDLAQFITHAHTSPDQAFAWSRERFPLLDREADFLEKAAFHLAQNDPDLAKTLLASRKAPRHRQPLITALVQTNLSSDFPATIQWLESLPNLRDYQACYSVNFQSWEQAQFIDQLEAALAVSTKPIVQSFLAENIVDYYRETDETKIIDLAKSLDGEAKKDVLNDLIMIQLDRDHPMANELIAELKGDVRLNDNEVLARNPGRFLEASLPYLTGDPIKLFPARRLATDWFKQDPEGALAWVTQNDPTNILQLPAHQRAQ
ncbi:MAG: RNA polymerase sigma factor [Verrucomicrobiaceae bacterium]